MSIFLFHCVSYYSLLVAYTFKTAVSQYIYKYKSTKVQYIGLETASVLTRCLLHESTENNSLIYKSWCGILIVPSGFLLYKGTASPNAHRASRSQRLAGRNVQCSTIVGIGDISGIQLPTAWRLPLVDNGQVGGCAPHGISESMRQWHPSVYELLQLFLEHFLSCEN